MRPTIARLTGVLAAVLALLAASATAGAATLRPGFYGCVHYDGASNQLQHRYNVVLAPRGAYRFAVFARNLKLQHPIPGTYRVRGTRIDFRTGPMKSRYAIIKHDSDTGQFLAVYEKAGKRFTQVSCHLQHRG